MRTKQKPTTSKSTTSKPTTSKSTLTRKKGGAAKLLAAKQATVPTAAATAKWTFLTNHAHVLIVLHGDPTMVLREVAGRVGITERAVQRIIHDLEEGGFLKREKVGRQNRYQVITDSPLRHPIEAHRDIGDLLGLISGDEDSL